MSYLFNSSEKFLDDTLKNLESLNSKNTYENDPDDWYPGVDKSGNGIAEIRFLTPLEGEDIATVKWFSHNFKNPKNDRWYIENSLKTLSEDRADPVAEFNKKLWNSTKDEDHPNRKQASAQKRQVNYRANVYVVSDSANPENNGKIKKWKFGKTFYDMIKLAMNPPVIEGALEQTKKINPFDLIKGANLKISIFSEKKGGRLQRNYSRSTFKESSKLFEDMDKIKALYDLYQSEPTRWSLKKYIADDKFKDYDTLKKRLDYVMEFDTATGEPLKSNTSNRNEPLEAQNPKEQKSTKSSSEPDDFDFETLTDS